MRRLDGVQALVTEVGVNPSQAAWGWPAPPGTILLFPASLTLLLLGCDGPDLTAHPCPHSQLLISDALSPSRFNSHELLVSKSTHALFPVTPVSI